LIVEDDPSITLGLESALEGEGYETRSVSSGTEGLRLARQEAPDLLILDLMLPGMSGLEICKKLRDGGMKIPVIMLTAKSDEDDKVLGLELGADDYVSKPFSLRELLARVKAHLRREVTEHEAPPSRIVFGDVEVDFKRHEVRRAGRLQEMTHREFCLLEYFVLHPGELLTRERLLSEIWGYDHEIATRTVDNHVLRLRKHIEPDPESPRHIKTVRGAGYLFEEQS